MKIYELILTTIHEHWGERFYSQIQFTLIYMGTDQAIKHELSTLPIFE
jgi:hypothetical protein